MTTTPSCSLPPVAPRSHPILWEAHVAVELQHREVAVRVHLVIKANDIDKNAFETANKYLGEAR